MAVLDYRIGRGQHGLLLNEEDVFRKFKKKNIMERQKKNNQVEGHSSDRIDAW